MYDHDLAKEYSTDKIEIEYPSFFSNRERLPTYANLTCSFQSVYSNSSKMYLMASGYLDVALNTLEKCHNDYSDNKGDLWIFPILFCIWQGLELFLKGLILDMGYLYNEQTDSNDDIEYKKVHKISEICKKIKEYNSVFGEDEQIENFDFVIKFVEMLEKAQGMNPNGDPTYTRFPTNLKDENHFYADTYNTITINTFALYIWINQVYRSLDNAAWYYRNQVEEYEYIKNQY